MKLPRDVSSDRLIRALERFGYSVVRQKGSHLRLRHPGPPLHTVTVPAHPKLKTGTLHGILSEVAERRAISIAADVGIHGGRALIGGQHTARCEHLSWPPLIPRAVTRLANPYRYSPNAITGKAISAACNRKGATSGSPSAIADSPMAARITVDPRVRLCQTLLR